MGKLQLRHLHRFAADGSAEIRFNLPLDRLQPGSFVLRVEAARDRSTVQRDIRFSVVGGGL
jgi:hypothetical protein